MRELRSVGGEAKGSDVCSCGAPKEPAHDVCTPCAWDKGWSEARAVSGWQQLYGCYAGMIQERVASCADYLGRITRHLAVSPSRHYVTEKAQELREAAGRLIASTHDVEGWLRSCGEVIDVRDGDDTWVEECVLEGGHDGPHRTHRPRRPIEEARDRAGDVAEASVAIADQLGWLFRDPQRLGDPDELGELGRRFDQLRRKVDRLSGALSALRQATSWAVGEPEDFAEEEGGWICPECEFEVEGLEQLAEHRREQGH